MSDKHTLPASLLAPNVDPGRLGFEDTSEIEPLEETIGQERAVEGTRVRTADEQFRI